MHPAAAALPLPIREHRFDPVRRWRLDLALPDHRIGIEMHGGTWSRGRHVRGAGIKSDCEKARALVLAGWRLLTYTDDDLRELGVGRIIEDVRALIEDK